MFGIGTTELIVIAIILIVFFGSKRMSELSHDLGESTKEFKKVQKEFEEAMSGKDLTEASSKETDSSLNKAAELESTKKGGAPDV